MEYNKEISLSSNTPMTIPESKKPTRKRTKVAETSSQATQTPQMSAAKAPRKRVKTSVESLPQINQSEISEQRTM